jgi:hypothetical protein
MHSKTLWIESKVMGIPKLYILIVTLKLHTGLFCIGIRLGIVAEQAVSDGQIAE